MGQPRLRPLRCGAALRRRTVDVGRHQRALRRVDVRHRSARRGGAALRGRSLRRLLCALQVRLGQRAQHGDQVKHALHRHLRCAACRRRGARQRRDATRRQRTSVPARLRRAPAAAARTHASRGASWCSACAEGTHRPRPARHAACEPQRRHDLGAQSSAMGARLARARGCNLLDLLCQRLQARQRVAAHLARGGDA